MKARTYGKKSKLPAVTCDAFLEPASPFSKPSQGIKTPLAETSHNVRLTPVTRSQLRKNVSINIFESPGKGSTTDTAFIAGSIPSSARSIVPRSKISNMQVGHHPPASHRKYQKGSESVPAQSIEDELSTAIADLSLESIHDPQHQRRDRTPIERRKLHERPAAVTDGTREYLRPLTECRSVSKCIEDFQAWMDERDGLLTISKIGEGSFGEVYRAQGGDEGVILKLMPLNAQKGKGSRSFTSVADAKNETRLLARMSKVPGFVEFRGACVLQGAMPRQLIHQWNEYLLSGRTVESRDPGKKTSYPTTQLWLLVEMSDAGESLERGRYAPPGQGSINTPKSTEPYLPVRYTWDIFWQIARALAKGEVFAAYEHRDLHLGNICVKEKVDSTNPRNARPNIHFSTKASTTAEALSQIVFGIDHSGVEVTLIDYSLSRAELNHDEILAYDFKNDKALLRGKGDLQYEMYRHMADTVGPRQSSDFVPQTNLMWLHYVLEMLLRATLSEELPAESEMLIILTELKEHLHPSKRLEWVWGSAGDLLHMGVEENWFLPMHVIDA